jgi:putative Holliday junction resolvase
VREGVRLGIDVGKVRIGVARCDPAGMLATPLETVRRANDRSDLRRLVALAAEYDAIEAVVGLPLALSGNRTASTHDAEGFATALAGELSIPVRLVDERLSTVSASAALTAAGRTAKNSRQIIDQAAATVILQHALDAERASGRAPGHAAEPSGGPTP